MRMQIMMIMIMMVVIMLNKVVGFLVLIQFGTLKSCHLVVHCPGIHQKSDNTSPFRLKPFLLWVNVDI